MFSYVPQMGRGGFCNMDNTITTITGVIYLLSSVITAQLDNKGGYVVPLVIGLLLRDVERSLDVASFRSGGEW